VTESQPPQTPAEDASALERVLFEVKRVIVGQDRLVERMIVSLLSRGHCLLEGVPGVAKTLAVETLAQTVSGSFARLQFTPDLVPSDIVGTRIYRPGAERFDTELGPIMANFVLADEINRAPAKVQSAMLEVMASASTCRARSWSWRRRTRSSPRVSTHCPRPSGTASS
jgi:MoxR-like ATPase